MIGEVRGDRLSSLPVVHLHTQKQRAALWFFVFITLMYSVSQKSVGVQLASVCSTRVGGIPPTLGTEDALLSSCTWPGWLEAGSAGPAGGPVEQGLCQDGGLWVAGLLPGSSG